MTRNSLVLDGWAIEKIVNYNRTSGFSCQDEDLDDFFCNAALAHDVQLLTQTYEMYEATVGQSSPPVALISFCNDAVKLRDLKDYNPLPDGKNYPFIPAVKIARLGVSHGFQGANIGSHLLNMAKLFFKTDNRTGCRFITVDSYNTPRALHFYQKNGFDFLNSKEMNKPHPTMFFDLINYAV